MYGAWEFRLDLRNCSRLAAFSTQLAVAGQRLLLAGTRLPCACVRPVLARDEVQQRVADLAEAVCRRRGGAIVKLFDGVENPEVIIYLWYHLILYILYDIYLIKI